MTGPRRRRGRPLSEVARQFLTAAAELPRPTATAVGAQLQMSQRHATLQASRLVAGGWCRWADEREPTATRPARVLEVLPEPQEPMFRGDELAGVFGLMIRAGRD